VDTLDSILEKNGLNKNIDFIKMDIEGFETEVLNQSVPIIRNRSNPSILR